ncbi:UbiE/COQ5 methyltransferase [Pelagophyceae sp. CCMP2097]|nr:UbiE/COQ5 methyltransferase [Pelagophyceae sp. CCMP2097]
MGLLRCPSAWRLPAAARRCLSGETTHFGERTVPVGEKEGLVKGVFSSVASNYDVMNDFMSGGMHRLWKDDYVKRLGLAACARAAGAAPRVLDVAGGTGDIGFRMVEELSAWLPPNDGAPAAVTVSDPNAEMLAVGRKKANDRNISPRSMTFDIANAQSLPYDDNSFDFITISFGLRNVTDIDAALREMRRVLRRGGRWECLEFSRVDNAGLRALYDVYSSKVIPELGERVAGDRGAYEYLVESIRKHPSQLELVSRVAAAGFSGASYRNLTFGVVAIHTGYKD